MKTLPNLLVFCLILLGSSTSHAQTTDAIFSNGAEDFVCFGPIFSIPPAPLTFLTGSNTNWPAFFGRPFPSQPGDQGVSRLDAGSYIAVEFQVPLSGFGQDRKLQGVLSGTTGGQGVATVAVSPCPGEIIATRNRPNCTSFEADPSLGLTVPGNNFVLSNQRCMLIPGERYFLNIANRTCEGSQCATEISVQQTQAR